MNQMPSLLAPAGGMRALQTALRFGADAVYCGAKQYGLRAQANNFDEQQLAQAVRMAHDAWAQVNLTLNIFAFDGDLDGMVRTAKAAHEIGVDAVIVSDLGAIARIAREVPGLDVHVSTQASTTNSESARIYKSLGAKRVVLAREMTFDQIEAMYRRRNRAGNVHPWRGVHVLFRTLHALQLPERTERKQGCMQPAMPLDLYAA